MAGVAFPMANPNLLVRTPLDLAVCPVHHRDPWSRHSDRVAADDGGCRLVHLPHCARLDRPSRQPPDVCVGRPGTSPEILDTLELAPYTLAVAQTRRFRRPLNKSKGTVMQSILI